MSECCESIECVESSVVQKDRGNFCPREIRDGRPTRERMGVAAGSWERIA